MTLDFVVLYKKLIPHKLISHYVLVKTFYTSGMNLRATVQIRHGFLNDIIYMTLVKLQIKIVEYININNLDCSDDCINNLMFGCFYCLTIYCFYNNTNDCMTDCIYDHIGSL